MVELEYTFFLLTFLTKRRKDKLPTSTGMSYEDWTNSLGKDPLVVTEYFVEKGALIRSSLYDHLNELDYTKLRDIAMELSTPMHIKKANLVHYLLEHGDQKKIWGYIDFTILELSDRGKVIIHDYLANLSEKRSQDIVEALNTSSSKIKRLFTWASTAAAGGVIGNRADYVFVNNVVAYIQSIAAHIGFFVQKPVEKLTQTIQVVPQSTYNPFPHVLDPVTSLALLFSVILAKVVLFFRKKPKI
jgi:hypothetical protein